MSVLELINDEETHESAGFQMFVLTCFICDVTDFKDMIPRAQATLGNIYQYI